MTPHKQLFRHRPDQGSWGDCYRTAVGCLLDLAPDQVPHVYDGGVDGPTGQATMDRFLAERGLRVVNLIYSGNVPLAEVLATVDGVNPGLSFLLTGQSRNGVDHVVVCRDGQIAWDPSLDDSGIIGPAADGLWWIEFLGARL